MIRFHVVCQSGWLETLSCICVGSIITNVECDYQIAVGIPRRFGSISRSTMKFLESVGVEIWDIDNTLEPEYPIGNKVFHFAQTDSSMTKISLDSDAICMRPYRGEMISDLPSAVVQDATCPVYGHPPEVWKSAFDGLGTTHLGSFYSAAFVTSPPNHEFPAIWLDRLKRVHAFADRMPPHKIRQYDQFALTAAAEATEFNSIPSWDERGLLVNTPDRFHSFDQSGNLVRSPHPYFYILQRNFLYRPERQGTPKSKISNPNTLYYYDDVRNLILSIVRRWKIILDTPAWGEYCVKIIGPSKRKML